MTPLEELGTLADTAIDLEVELDRRFLTVRQILEMEPGGVVQMTRSAGENVDILIEGTLIGFGEIVIIEEAMGIRITDFLLEE
ncbi:MAG: FliM/FliN family flagellar motor switch protein [Acidobacteria bacterium]|nr:FliM/FliN family flagellar motor switch protein [Acidobacteriota bacterium]